MKKVWSDEDHRKITLKIKKRLKNSKEIYEWLYDIFKYMIDIEPKRKVLRRMYMEAIKHITDKL